MSASVKNITEALSRIAAGVVTGATRVNLKGLNPAPTTTFETVWGNSNLYTFLAANMASPTIVSSSANDTAAGTGARTLTVSGVDSTYIAQTETVILNGTSTVALTKNYMTINSMAVATVGSGGVTAGNLTIVAGGVTHGYVQAGYNNDKSFIYCTSSTKGLLLYNLLIGEEAASAGGSRSQILYVTNSVGGGITFTTSTIGLPTNAMLVRDFAPPRYFPPKTQIQLQFLSAAATSTVTATGGAVLIDTTTPNISGERWI